ncbi:MAG TPA: glycosyltransferase [Patescibacteria group bacterium]|nr:glycosyltransferase [Patescibacteria group bacterium]
MIIGELEGTSFKDKLHTFRIKKRVGKYEYVIEKDQAWIVRLMGLLGLASALCLGFGYYRFIRVEALLIVLSLPFLIVFVYFVVGAILQLFYPGFDSHRHATFVRNYWLAHTDGPRIAVFIPAAGEPVTVVGATAGAAAAMHYANKRVYILDDTPAGIYRETAKTHGVEYIHRPHSGQGKKSGNLNYALQHTPDTDHVLVLDADFVPRAEMLHEVIPYTASDIAIIQTPQHFVTSKEIFKKSKIQYGAAFVQREFYRLTQVGRNRFGSAICVGTNALYNRRALDNVGGYAEVDHSEDVNTGLKMLNFVRDNGEPYRIRYLPVQLATGECPDTYYSFYKQQSRWATGSFRLVFSRRTMFSRVIRPTQKLIYFSNCLYYLYTICILAMPLQLLGLALTKHANYQWVYLYAFIPQIIMRLVVTPYVFRQERKRLATIIVTMATAYTFVQALYLLITKRPLGWEATGVTHGPKHNRFQELKIFSAFYFIVIYAGTLSVAILNEAMGRQTALFLQLLFVAALLSQTIHLAYLFLFGTGEHQGRVGWRPVASLATVLLIAAGVAGVAFSRHDQYNLYAAGTKRLGLVHQQTPADTPSGPVRVTLKYLPNY